MAPRIYRIILPVALLLLGIVAILLLTIPTEDINEEPQFMYGIVLDAGSSHTAVYIYKWPSDKQNGTGVVTQHTECHVTGGGISSYAGQRGAAGLSLEGCMNQAVQNIPKNRHIITPVYLGATAGMRLLNMSSPGQSEQILQEVGHKIQSYPFDYRGATILSGQEEGVYGWVTVNYLLENFIKYGLVGRWLSPGRVTVGALDFGGASTQITFVTPEEVEDKRDWMRLRLYGQEYHLYTHSFLCYGRDQVLRRILAHLFTSQGHPETVYHPCYPEGYTVTLKPEIMFDSPCTASQKPSSYNPQHALLSVKGTGHYEHCMGNVSEMFSFHSCPYSKCSFDKVFQPNISGSFMAFSAFFYIHAFLQRATGISISSPAQLEEATRAICNMSYSQMLSVAPEQDSRLQEYCSTAVFTQVLLLRGYGFDDGSFQKVSFQKRAGGTAVGWALGYMLNLSSLLPEESVGLRKALRPGAWTAVIVLLALLLAAALVYILLQVRQEKKNSSREGIL